MRDESGCADEFGEHAEIACVDRSSPLACNHAALTLDLLRIEAEVSNTIGFKVVDQLHRGSGKPVLVDGHIVCRIGVVAAPGIFHYTIEFAGPVLLGAVEHHMFKEVRKPGGAWTFVARADPVKDVECNIWNRRVFLHEYLHSVLERVRLDVKALGAPRGRQRDNSEQGEAQTRAADQSF